MADQGPSAVPHDAVYGLAIPPDSAGGGASFVAARRGLLRSTDSGLSWQPALASLALTADLPATSVALAPNGAVLAGLPGGIVVSIDDGGSWSIATLPDPPPFIAAIAVSPSFARDGTAFAATLEDGVFCSRDGGMSWTAWNIGLLDHNTLCLAVSPAYERDATVFAGAESGLFVSANGGRYWQATGLPAEAASVLSIALSPDFERDGTILSGTDGQGIVLSADRGQSWQPLPTPAGAVNSVLIDPGYPARPRLLALIDETPFLSRDGGRSWAPLSLGSSHSLTTIAAPLGLEEGAPLVAGAVDGTLLRATLRLL